MNILYSVFNAKFSFNYFVFAYNGLKSNSIVSVWKHQEFAYCQSIFSVPRKNSNNEKETIRKNCKQNGKKKVSRGSEPGASCAVNSFSGEFFLRDLKKISPEAFSHNTRACFPFLAL